MLCPLHHALSCHPCLIHILFLPLGFPVGQWCHRIQLCMCMFKVLPHETSTVSQFALTAKLWKPEIMAMKWKSLDLNTKLEIICLCEVSSLSKSGTGRQSGLISLVLFTMLKNKEKIQYIQNLRKRTLFLSFMSTYGWHSFHELSLWLCDVCNETRSIIGAGTTDGMDPVQVSYKEYFH